MENLSLSLNTLTPSVSVIIATYNRPQQLHEALKSINYQHYNNLEAIIINDGGENVDSVINVWKRKILIQFEENGTNLGLAYSRNRAINLSKGDYLAFLDDDDIFLPCHIKNSIEYLSGGKADLIYFKTLVSPMRYQVTDLASSLGFENKNDIYFDFPFDSSFLHIMNYIPIISVVCKNFKKTQIRFNESLRVCEDWDIWLQLINIGKYRFLYNPNLTSIYHRIPNEKSLTNTSWEKAGNELFNQARNTIFKRFQNGHPRLDYFKSIIHDFAEIREELVKSNQLSHFYYEKFLKYLYDAFKDTKLHNVSKSTIVDIIKTPLR